MFFSEEKNQKTFALDAIPVVWTNDLNLTAGAIEKVFWFVSSEKNCFFSKLLSLLDFFPDRHLETVTFLNEWGLGVVPSGIQGQSPGLPTAVV